MARSPEKVLTDIIAALNLQLANNIAQVEKLADDNTALRAALAASQDDTKKLGTQVVELQAELKALKGD